MDWGYTVSLRGLFKEGLHPYTYQKSPNSSASSMFQEMEQQERYFPGIRIVKLGISQA